MFLAVAAGVIGGTPLAGGSGTIIGGLIGAAVLGVLNDGFTLIGINAFTFNIILGAAILVAMLFNIHMTRFARERWPRMQRDPATEALARRRTSSSASAPVTALDGVSLHAAAGRDPRHPRRQRRRQVDTDEDPHRLSISRPAARCIVHGREVTLRSVDHARALGIECVYQDLALANSLSVYHNMFLNREIVHRGPFRLLNNRAMRRRAAECLEDIGVHIPSVDLPVERLSGRPAPGDRRGARGEFRKRKHPVA